MDILGFIKKELSGFGKYERIIFPLEILLIFLISFYINDDKAALVSAVCGISYTILAGKGKVSCFFIGLIGTLCYTYISLKNSLFGNAALYAFYYFPMEIIGIFQWRKHLDNKSNSIIKVKLKKREKAIYFITSIVAFFALALILKFVGDKSPYIDSFTTVFSIVGLLLTVKRSFEQWYIWILVNLLSSIMWIKAYLDGSNCFATVIMWVTYFILSIYFLYTWKKELDKTE